MVTWSTGLGHMRSLGVCAWLLQEQGMIQEGWFVQGLHSAANAAVSETRAIVLAGVYGLHSCGMYKNRSLKGCLRGLCYISSCA